MKNELPKTTYLFFGVGGVALGIVGVALAYFLLIYYNQVLGAPAHLVSAALAIALVFDAFFDPYLGVLSDRTRSSLGRRHPFIYFSAAPLAIAYWFLWNPPAMVLQSEAMLVTYLTGLLIVFRVLVTFFDIPSNAMVPELTRDYDRRTLLMSARISTSWVAGIVFVILMYAIWLRPEAGEVSGVLSAEGYQRASWFGAAIIAGVILLFAIGTHRHVPALRADRPRASAGLLDTWRAFGAFLKNRSFRALMIFAVIYRSADGLTAALWVYIMTFFWGRNTDEVALLSAVNLVGALCAMAIIPLLTRRFDKRNIAIFVTLCSILTGGGSAVARMLGWIPEGVVFPVLVAQSALDTAMVVTVSTLLGSMISDTVEDLQKESGLRREGAVVAGQTFVNKVAIASGAWAAGLVLTLIQFPQVGQDQEVSEAKIFLLGAVYVAVIACAYLGAAVALRRYAIDRNAHARNVVAVSAMEGVG